jgi:hypothetical protein
MSILNLFISFENFELFQHIINFSFIHHILPLFIGQVTLRDKRYIDTLNLYQYRTFFCDALSYQFVTSEYEDEHLLGYSAM